MSTNTSSADYGRFEALAEEFAARFRRGERPSLQEYIDRCPDLADEIRELFPALVEVERVKENQPARPGAAEPAAALPPLGQVGDYRVLREVGRGGMGVVYEAEQVSLGRRVALKVLPRQVAQDLKTLARFRREARSAAQLHHTNIVPVFEVGKDGEVSYYAMQFIQGQGLDTVIDELRRLKDRAQPSGLAQEPQRPDPVIPSGPTAAGPARSRPVSQMAHSLLTGQFVPVTPDGPGEAEAAGTNQDATAPLSHLRDHNETAAPAASDAAPVAVSSPPSSVVLPGGSQLSAVESRRRSFYRSAAHIGRQVAAGLAYAHARGIVHRDIKPSNLLLDTEGVVWITDFGLAKASDDRLTQTGDILGTIRYMAPERFRGEGDGRADVYALGLTLYELVTLCPAFDSSDRLKLIEQIKAEDPPRPRALDTRIPRDLETIVQKAIAKDPKDRYPSADALGEDLRRFLADEPIKARPVGPLERAWIWARRRPALAGLLAVGFIAALAMVGAIVGAVSNARMQVVLKVAERARRDEEQQRKRAEQFQYFHDIARASAGWREGNVGERTDQLLDDCPVDRRHWEWHYLKRFCHADLLTLTGHTGWVYCVAFSPDGTRLASASWDRTVKLWNATTGEEIHRLEGHEDQVWAVAFSPDGTRLASAGGDRVVNVWDVETGRLTGRLTGHTGVVYGVAFSPDGTRIASSSDDTTVRVWDTATGRQIHTLRGHRKMVVGVTFSPDGSLLASTSFDRSVKVWDAIAGDERRNLLGHTDRVTTAAFSPDGKRLASAGHDRTVKIWDVASWSEIRTLQGHTGVVRWLAFSPDGKRLASASWDGSAKLWDPATGQDVLTLKGHAFGVRAVAFSPDGTRLATAGNDQAVKVWDATTGQEARTLIGHTRDVALGGLGRASHTALMFSDLTGGVAGVTFLEDGTRLASAGADGTVKVWEATTGREVCTLAGHTGPVWSVAVSPLGTWLASAGGDQLVKLWDFEEGREIRTLTGHTGAVYSVAFSLDGTRLASASDDTTVRVWEAATGKELRNLSGHTSAVHCVAFSPDSKRLASVGADRTVKIWNVTTGEVQTLLGHANVVYGVAFSPDGKRLASASHDGTVKLWDVDNGQEAIVLQGHASWVYGVAFSPDGKRLASASIDQTVKIWDTATGHDLLTLSGHNDMVWGVAFSPDGKRLASAGRDGTVKLWDARPWTPDAAFEREAVGLLDSLFARPLRKADVIDYLRNESTIRPPARQLALTLVNRYHEETNPETYHQESWALVRQPYLNAFQYRFALLQAEHACRVAPDRQAYRVGLGAALYRVGRYQEAVESLGRADRPDQGSPAALAFLAKAHHRLGQHEQARTVLARLRQLLNQPRWAKDSESLDLMYEAEAVIAPPRATTER
jgi:WD40 repeat protein/serine/threonine protein kinase